MAAAERHFTRRITAIRRLITAAQENPLPEDGWDDISRELLDLAATWTPDALAGLLIQVLDLAALEGRETALAEAEVPVVFAEPDFTRQEFREQIDFLTQKRGKPTKVWTDAMLADHDRAFVVAGVTDMSMLEEFQAAVIEGARTYDIGTFASEFDRLVEKYGWSYNGGRDWRIRTIFETNIRTSYMAGRLRQMRDPDMVKLRPYWQYLHADTRVPLSPRPQHVTWDRLVLMWNDPWWDIHFPPNDWKCSCGVRTLSKGDLRRLGKDGPDTAPDIVTRPYTHQASGETVQLPEGIGYGWNYMPGDTWERGLVPSAVTDEAGGLRPDGRDSPRIDIRPPLQDLIDASRPFTAQPMERGLPQEDYVRAFLQPFGAEIGSAVLWEDPAGTRLPISDQLFRDPQGTLNAGDASRAQLAPLLAETLMDPDEIWVGVARKPDPVDPVVEELVIDRRYIRVDAETGLFVVFQIGRRWWEAITAYLPQDRQVRSKVAAVDWRRGGKLVWKRK